jgi:uncharacterized protein (DUF2249 family)
MTAIKLIKKHDPDNLGEFTNTNYIEMFAYAKEIETELLHAKQENEKLRASIIDEVIDKVESMKGLAGKMSMGEWSSQMVEMLEQLKNG